MSLRWCTTTLGGTRHDHDNLADAKQRAGDLATQVLTGSSRADRMVIWSNADDGHGWTTHAVIDLHALTGAR